MMNAFCRRKSGLEGVMSVKQQERRRQHYMPDVIQTLLIAEAPPPCGRFFYHAEVPKHDYLFLGVMDVLFREQTSQFLHERRDKTLKKRMLVDFKSQGFYLVDLFDRAGKQPEPAELQAVERLLGRLTRTRTRNIISPDSPVILIKVNIYDTLYRRLKELSWNVIDVRMPFPSHGHQDCFRTAFGYALTLAGRSRSAMP
jgi:hypothetical protein